MCRASHPNEQVTYILNAALKFAIDGKENRGSQPGKCCWQIPRHMPTKPGALEG